VGSRLLPGQKEPQLTTHFAGRVRLVAEAPKGEKLKMDLTRPSSVVAAADIYKGYFHGPAYQVLEAAWRKGDSAVGLMAHDLPPNHVPADSPLSVSPRLVELCFQAAGIHEMGTTGKMGLPNHVVRVRSLRMAEAAAQKRLYAVASAVSGGNYDVRVVDEAGHVYVVLEGYKTVELGPVDEASLAPFRSAMR